jgi:hypothetical protein
VEQGADDPNMRRFYKLYVAGETFLFEGYPGDKVTGAIEEVYKKAIKNMPKKQEPDPQR